MLYCSWDMACDGCNCDFSFWAIFCSFIPLAAPEMKISKKWKRRLEISSFKVSEYRFKENKNTLKNIKVLLYTHFYNIFLNVLRPTPFSVYVIYPFHTFQISEKLGSKLGQRLTTFPTLWAPAPTKLYCSIIFFHWYSANQETNKTVPAIFFFSNIFWIIYF